MDDSSYQKGDYLSAGKKRKRVILSRRRRISKRKIEYIKVSFRDPSSLRSSGWHSFLEERRYTTPEAVKPSYVETCVHSNDFHSSTQTSGVGVFPKEKAELFQPRLSAFVRTNVLLANLCDKMLTNLCDKMLSMR